MKNIICFFLGLLLTYQGSQAADYPKSYAPQHPYHSFTLAVREQTKARDRSRSPKRKSEEEQGDRYDEPRKKPPQTRLDDRPNRDDRDRYQMPQPSFLTPTVPAGFKACENHHHEYQNGNWKKWQQICKSCTENIAHVTAPTGETCCVLAISHRRGHQPTCTAKKWEFALQCNKCQKTMAWSEHSEH
ncbi:MAG: hypothetical protein RLZ12_147, partial [Bacillota bacterium]